MVNPVPMLSEDSVLCWELESTFKSAPAAATWQSFGRVNEWVDLGPENAVFRDHVAGAGREAHSVGYEGQTFTGTVGPFQVVNPRVLGFAWGQEVDAPVLVSGSSYRHTVTPTVRGRLPSMSVHMRDVTGESSAKTDKTTFLGVVVPRLTLRGEAVNEDGSGGRLLAALDLVAHKDDPTVADKAVTVPTTEPYRYEHGNITLYGEQVYRVVDWELTVDNQVQTAFYWQDSDGNLPYESPPGAMIANFSASIVADDEEFTSGSITAKTLKDIAREQLTGNGTLTFTRTASTDTFDINLTDIVLQGAPKRRRLGAGSSVVHQVRGIVRATSLEYVDTYGDGSTASNRFFPS